MVHALKEAWRVLRSRGILIDLRPRHSNQLIEMINNGQPQLIRNYNDTHRVSNDNAADRAMTAVVHENLFGLEKSAMYEYVKYYDTGSELMDYFLTRNPPVQHPQRVVKQILRADAEPDTILRYTNDMQLKSYRKIG